MPFINGRWVDEEELLAMQASMTPTIGGYDRGPDAEWGLTNLGGIYDTPPVVGGEGVTPGYNPGLDASIINESIQSQAPGMLAPTPVNPLQAFAEPAFTQPLAALNRQATVDYDKGPGSFQEMDIGAMLAAMGPQAYSPPEQLQAPQIQAPIPQAPQMQAPVPQAPQAPQMQAPQAPQRQAPAPFVAPAYTAPTELAPIDVEAIRGTVSAPAPFDFSGISGGRLAEARKYAGQGMFGRAKQQVELGGGDWSKAMHLALRGETGMSPADLARAKDAAVNQAKLARQSQHAANVSAAQEKHAANVLAAQQRHAAKAKGAADKIAAADKVAAARLASQQAAAASAAAQQQQQDAAAAAAAAKAEADRVAAAAAAQSSTTDASYTVEDITRRYEALKAEAEKARSEDRDGDYNTGSFGPFSKERVKSWFESWTGGDYSTYDKQQNFIESLRNSGFISAEEAQQLKGQHLQQWSPFGNVISGAVQPWDQVKDTDWTGWNQFLDAWRTGAASGKNQLIGGAATFPGIGKPSIEALIQAVTSGNIDPSELKAFLKTDPGTISSADIAEILSGVDTFADIDVGSGSGDADVGGLADPGGLEAGQGRWE